MRACMLGKISSYNYNIALKWILYFFGFSKLGEKAMTTEKNNDLN